AVGSPVMHGAHKPAKFLVKIQEFEALIGPSGGRNVKKGQQYPCDDLDDEAEKRHAPKCVEPADAALWDGVAGGRFPKFNQMEPASEPHRNVDQPSADLLGLLVHTFMPGLARVGSTPPLTISSPF